jgi:hypothetical protein
MNYERHKNRRRWETTVSCLNCVVKAAVMFVFVYIVLQPGRLEC